MPLAEALTSIPTLVDGSLPHMGSPLDPLRMHEDVPSMAAAAAAMCNLLLWAWGAMMAPLILGCTLVRVFPQFQRNWLKE